MRNGPNRRSIRNSNNLRRLPSRPHREVTSLWIPTPHFQSFRWQTFLGLNLCFIERGLTYRAHHGPVEIVRSVGERDLGRLLAEHDPVGLHVIEVVEHQPRQRDHPQIDEGARLHDVGEFRVLRVKGERDDRLEAAGFLLQGSQSQQVIDPMPRLFDVAVEHGRVRAEAEAVGFAMHVEPDVGVGFVFAELLADFGIEDFRTAAGEAAETGVDHRFEDAADRLFGDAG